MSPGRDYDDWEAAQDREAWAAMIADGGRIPTELKEMPTQGKVLVAAPCRWQAAVRLATKHGLDYFLNDLVPSDVAGVIVNAGALDDYRADPGLWDGTDLA